jgi:hypothetical protein
MKTLKTQFRKNGLDCMLIKRNDKIALFQLGHSSDPDGYEVCRIYIMRKHSAFGVNFEESEIITSNDQFHADGSGTFRCLDNALKHFDRLSNKFVRKGIRIAKSPSGAELIAECQPVGDIASYGLCTGVHTPTFEGGSGINYTN